MGKRISLIKAGRVTPEFYEQGRQLVDQLPYRHSPERTNDLLAACEERVLLIKQRLADVWDSSLGDREESRQAAMALMVAVDGVRVMQKIGKPEQAIPLMFDVGFLATRLQVPSIPQANQTLPMTPTEAARRLGYWAKKSESDAGRKKVEREIESGALRAIRTSGRSRKWFFDKRQVPDA